MKFPVLQQQAFIPGAHYHVLTPFYEALVRPFMGGIWRRIAAEAARRAPERGTVLDAGCGPGNILRCLRTLRHDLRITGTDIDPAMIRIAERRSRGIDLAFSVAPIDRQPFPDRSMDVVTSSLMFHHLPAPTKRAALCEMRRILKPGGTFLLCDFSKPPEQRWWLSLEFWKHIEPEIIPQLEGQLLDLAREAGATVETLWTSYGCVSLHALRFPHTE